MRRKSKAPPESQGASDLLALLQQSGVDVALGTDLVTPVVIPTPFHVFNSDHLRIGGIPIGQITEVTGPEGSGKTSFAYLMVAQAQKQFPDKMVAWLDSEFRFNKDRAQDLGVDLSRLLIKRTAIMEPGFEWTLQVVNSGAVSLIVLDSLGNLLPKTAHDASQWKMDTKGKRESDRTVADTARYETEWGPVVESMIFDKNVAFLMLNQDRTNVGVSYGDPTTQRGAKALKHGVSLRLRFRKVEDIEEGTEVVGSVFAVDVRKNLYGPRMKTDDMTHLRIYNENPIEKLKVRQIYDRLITEGIVTRNAGWFSWVDPETGEILRKWNGEKKFMKALEEDNELVSELQGVLNGLGATESAVSRDIDELD